MSAEILRRAAESIRTDWPMGERCPDGCSCEDEPAMSGYHERASFHLAVAALLDRVADDYAIAQYGYWSECALKVARTHLEKSRHGRGDGE